MIPLQPASYPVTLLLGTGFLLVTLISLVKTPLRFRLFLHPVSIVRQQEYYRLVSSDLVHHDLVHLLLNEYLLIIYGKNLEAYLNHTVTYGSLKFLVIYLVSCLCGTMGVTIMHRKDSGFSSAGASGSLMGCMFAYIMMQPRRVAFFAPAIGPISNLYFGLICILALIIYQRRSKNELISHEQHFFGALGGMLAALILIPGIIK
jgi:membrane associated rhomboid family serine protease